MCIVDENFTENMFWPLGINRVFVLHQLISTVKSYVFLLSIVLGQSYFIVLNSIHFINGLVKIY